MDGCFATPPYHSNRASCFLYHIKRLALCKCHSGLSPIVRTADVGEVLHGVLFTPTRVVFGKPWSVQVCPLLSYCPHGWPPRSSNYRSKVSSAYGNQSIN